MSPVFLLQWDGVLRLLCTVISKATQRIYFLKQLKWAGLPQDQLLNFYSAVILPVTEYAAPVWHHLLNKTKSDQLEAIQKRTIRIIFSTTYDMPYISALYIANLPALVEWKDQLCHKFFTTVLEPSSCLQYIISFPHLMILSYYLALGHPQNIPEFHPKPKNVIHIFCTGLLTSKQWPHHKAFTPSPLLRHSFFHVVILMFLYHSFVTGYNVYNKLLCYNKLLPLPLLLLQ